MSPLSKELAATLEGQLVAVGAIPVHGARHDVHAYAASGLREALGDTHTLADLGYVGVDGIDLTPIRKPAGAELHDTHAEFNTQLSNQGRGRTRYRAPQDMADAQRGRRSLPTTDNQIRQHAEGRDRTVLLQYLG